jgi:hypothetical protein
MQVRQLLCELFGRVVHQEEHDATEGRASDADVKGSYRNDRRECRRHPYRAS